MLIQVNFDPAQEIEPKLRWMHVLLHECALLVGWLMSYWFGYSARGSCFIIHLNFPHKTHAEKVILHPDLDGAPLLILANKQDRMVGEIAA